MTRLCSPVIRARGKLRAGCEEQEGKRSGRASVSDNVGELANAEQEAGELRTDGATGSDMFAQSYGGRASRASKFRIEQAVAANGGVRYLRKRSAIVDFGRGQYAEQQDDSSSGDDDGDLASEQYPESSGSDFEGLSSSELALAAAVEAYGRLENFEGDAAEFPGQTGDVGLSGETILCGKCRDSEGSKPCLVCDECDRSFHVSCLKIRPKTAERYDEWLCDLCGSAESPQRRPLGKVALNARYSMNRLMGSEDRMSSKHGSSHEYEKMLKPGVNAVEDDKIEGRPAKVGEVSKPSVPVDSKMTIDVKSEKVEVLADGDGSDQFLERLGSTSDLHCHDKVNARPDENNGATMKVEPGLKSPLTNFRVRGAQNLGSHEEKAGPGDTGPTESGGIGSHLSGDPPQSGIEDKVWDGRRLNKDAQESQAVYALEQLKTFVAENCGMVSLDGWTATVKDRVKEGRIGSVRTYFFSPEKKRFSSKQEVFRYFESLANVSTPSGEEHGSSTGRVKTRSSSGKAGLPSRKNVLEEQCNSREGQEFQDTVVEKEAIAGQTDRSENIESLCMASGTMHHMQFPRILGSPATSPLPPASSGGGCMALDFSKNDPTELQVGEVLGPAQSAEAVIEVEDNCKMTEREVDAILQLRRYVTERNGFLGEGWTADITSRPKRGSVVCDVKYYSPDRKVLRSRAEVLRYLGLQDLKKIEGLAGQEQSIRRVCAVPSEESHLKDVDKATVLHQLKSFISEKHGTLEEGWNVEVRRRTGGNATDKIYVSPGKQKFRSRLEVARFLGLDSSKTRNQGLVQQSNLEMPIRSGELNIESLGEVDKWSDGDGSTIWPVGYRSTWHDVHTGSFCISEVADGGHAGPVFRVTRRSCAIFLGRQDAFGDCSGVQEHTTGWAGVSSDLKDEMGEFAVEASTSIEAWKAFAERCAEWWRARPQTHILPSSARKLALNHADWTVESENGHEIVVLGEDSCSEDETDGQIGCVNHLAAANDPGQMLSELVERMRQDRFGLADEVVQTALKLRLQAKAQDEMNSQEGKDIGDSGELSSKKQSPLKQGGTAGQAEEAGQLEDAGQAEEAEEVVLDSPVHAQGRTLPVGVTFGAKLPHHLAGDVLEIWEFLCRFADVIGIQLPSFDDFEDGLVEPWEPSSQGASGKDDLVSSGQPVEQIMSDALESNKELGAVIAPKMVNQHKDVNQVASRGITALANIHIPLIKLLISDMKQKILGIQSMDEELKLRQGKKRSLEDELLLDVERESCLPMNLITWPDVAHRYILALLALKREDEDPERRHQHYSRIFRLLQGDGGVLYGGLDGMAGAEADAQLLGSVEKQLLTRMPSSDATSVLSPVDARAAGCLTEDSSVKSMVEEVSHLQKGEEKELWVQILEPVAQIPTNTGARIRNRVQESLKERPPEWARKVLEWSITKEVFKGNAAGPTKHAVLSVLAKVRGEEVKPRKCRVRARKIVPSPALITQRCRLVLREVAAADTSRVFCFLYGNGVFDANELEGDGSLKTTSGVIRPLDLRTIDLRLEAGVYMHSPEAFAADVRQIWKNAEAVYKDGSKMLRLSQKLSELFDELYEKQVRSLLQGSIGPKKRKDLPAVESRPVQPLGLEAVKSGKKSVASCEKPGLIMKDQWCQNKESPEKAGGGELLKAPWDEESCRICGVDDDYDNVLLCDGCEAEYHTYCLKPPLTKVPEGKWFCPHCLALEKSFPERLVDDNDAIEDQKTAEYHQNSVFDKSPLRALAERMEGREYWQLSTAEMVFLLRVLCDEALDTSTVRANLDKSLDQSLELQQKLRLLVAERSQPRNVRIKKRAPDECRAVAATEDTPPARVQTRAERFERRFRLDEVERGNLEYKPKSYSIRNHEASQKGSQNDQVMDVVLKRKRGRPPKVRNSEEDSLMSSPGIVPKRRGRPPKATIVVEKRRGRPPKRKFEAKEEAPAKRRGRPPKKVSEALRSVQVDLEPEAPVVSARSKLSPGIKLRQTAAEIRESPNPESAPRVQHMDQEKTLLPSSLPVLSESEMVLECLGSDKELCAQDKASLEAGPPDPPDAKLRLRGEELPADDTGINTCGVGQCLDNENVVPVSMTLDNKPAKETPKSDQPNNDLESDVELSVDSAEEESNMRLDLEIENLELELMNISLRREFVGRDNLGRQYWIVCGPGRRPQVAVEELNMPYKEEGLSHTGSSYVENLIGRSDEVNNCERCHWMLYETESQLDELIAGLRYSKQERALRSSLSQWRKSLMVPRSGTELHPGVTGRRHKEKQLGRGGLSLSIMSIQEEGNKVFCKGFPVLRATRILERRFGPFHTFESLADGKIKGKMKRVESMYRCGCLEPVWAGRPHCNLCHETCADEGELMRHKCQYPGQPIKARKTKKQSTMSPLKSMQAGEPGSRKRKKVGHLSEEYFSTQLPDNVLQGDLHRVTKLKVRKRQSAFNLSGEMKESMATGADFSHEVLYGVSPEFQGTLSTPCDISGFRTGETGDGGVLEIGGVADGNLGSYHMQGHVEDSSLFGYGNKLGNSRRSARRKGVPHATEQVEYISSAHKHSSRENLIHEIKLLSEDLRPDANQDMNGGPTSSTNSLGFVTPSTWGPHFNASCMSFSAAESTRERVMQIGCIADKGPTFAPALSFAPAFDPSLMMQSSSEDTFTMFPIGCNGSELLTQQLSFETGTALVNSKVSSESFDTSLLHSCNSEDPLYRAQDECDDGGCLSASIIDFFATPNVDDQGWTMEEHGRFAIDDGVVPTTMRYEHVKHSVLPGARDSLTAGLTTDGLKMENICNVKDQREHAEVVCASVEASDAGVEAMNAGCQDVYVPRSSSELDGHESTMEVTEQKSMPVECPVVNLVEYEPPNSSNNVALVESAPAAVCTNFRSPDERKSPDDVLEHVPLLERTESQPVNSGEGSVCAAVQDTPCKTLSDRVQRTAAETQHGELDAEDKVQPTHCGFAQQVEEEDSAFEKTSNGTAAIDGPSSELTARLNIPEASIRPLEGKPLLLLKWLKMNLLDVEAALTPSMLEPARAEGGRRRAWRSLVKSAKSLFEVTQALFVLELMIRTEYLRSSWGHWFSLSAILKTANVSSVALRLFTLDTVTSYEVGSTQPKKRGRKKKTRAEENDAVSD